MNEENFLKLAEKLDMTPQAEFDMEVFRGTRNEFGDLESEHYYSMENCGTVGCALGQAPLTRGLEPIAGDFEIEIYGSKKNLNYAAYGERIFGIISGEIWDFIFSSEWREVDNTPKGAAARIRYLCKNGLPSEYMYDSKTVALYMTEAIKESRDE